MYPMYVVHACVFLDNKPVDRHEWPNVDPTKLGHIHDWLTRQFNKHLRETGKDVQVRGECYARMPFEPYTFLKIVIRCERTSDGAVRNVQRMRRGND